MRKSPLVQALLDFHLRMTLTERPTDDRDHLCEQIANLMGRDIVISNTVEQQGWLLAKAWASAVGRTKRTLRHSGPRRAANMEQIRAILAEVPKGA
ncbi:MULTISPECIES: hypothetical protein [unclassified Pseudomonas]|uniref:hypothetical protein n=1 Tax=unclassified Pseudomonas TaxID=196821 RepID=UPI00131B414F|nr:MULTISPECIES: hypothetical protein [unclassified Pseudomonas]